eukprot:CAMPEP_0194049614 /NCGR_PEP_ID=MMETSP0009_2-20130614/30790_1 /TAXON_ID=210454 /ORGANISM="Grammatophora oceanica, Strain CCMP 410" /LENGTH=128 /DNA_ID=CAMNT_0038695815 /DNA_START=32 /DNA_END=418 /DNA_ORIENTATION=+
MMPSMLFSMKLAILSTIFICAVMAADVPCELCGENNNMTKPNAVVATLEGVDFTCDVYAGVGDIDDENEDACAELLTAEISEKCGCVDSDGNPLVIDNSASSRVFSSFSALLLIMGTSIGTFLISTSA